MSRSLDDVNNEEWLMSVGTAMGEKDLVADRYTNYPEEKVSYILNNMCKVIPSFLRECNEVTYIIYYTTIIICSIVYYNYKLPYTM